MATASIILRRSESFASRCGRSRGRSDRARARRIAARDHAGPGHRPRRAHGSRRAESDRARRRCDRAGRDGAQRRRLDADSAREARALARHRDRRLRAMRTRAGSAIARADDARILARGARGTGVRRLLLAADAECRSPRRRQAPGGRAAGRPGGRARGRGSGSCPSMPGYRPVGSGRACFAARPRRSPRSRCCSRRQAIWVDGASGRGPSPLFRAR